MASAAFLKFRVDHCLPAPVNLWTGAHSLLL
jgi:hypothetical protein